MHPEVIKFWTHSEYYVETDVILPCDDMPYILFWFLMKNDKQIKCVGQSDPYDRNSEAYEQLRLLKEKPSCTIYFFDQEKYSEAEMLKLIKLKGFL